MTASVETDVLLREAIEYAPATGRTAPDLIGVWTHDGWYVCAPCVGRITARGCGHLFKGGEQVWADHRITGLCTTCNEGHPE